MKRLILHIGRAKTGTSSLQRALYENPDALYKGGFHYPPPIHEGRKNHNFTFRNLHKAPETADLREYCEKFDALLAEFSQDRVNILSAECLQNAKPLHVANLFKGFDVQVVCYLRNEIDMLCSSYCQHVKADDYQLSFSEFLAPRLSFLNYQTFLDSWAEAFRDKFSCRAYGEGNSLAKDIVADFNETYLEGALDTVPRGEIERRNPSLSLTSLKLSLYLNRNQKAFGWYFGMGNRDRIDAIGELSRRYPWRVRIPVEWKDQMRSTFEARQKIWAPKHFGVDGIFDYPDDHFADQNPESTEEERTALVDELRTIVVFRADVVRPHIGADIP